MTKERDRVEKLADELFSKIQRAQGFAFCSDGENFPTVDKFFERIRGRLEWNREASKIMASFLRKHGQSRAPTRYSDRGDLKAIR